MIDADGWLRTGDLGHVDADGSLYVVERLKELIKVNAYQVAPAELEALLATHPQVADVAVIGRPDARSGEVPIAVVVGREELDPDELLAWTAPRVAPYKRLGDVRLVDVLPAPPPARSCAGGCARPATRVIGSPRPPPSDGGNRLEWSRDHWSKVIGSMALGVIQGCR